jgi:hypothetical protein
MAPMKKFTGYHLYIILTAKAAENFSRKAKSAVSKC